MPTFSVHIGFELPFWLSLREGEYDVAFAGSSHKVSLNNSVNRLEIGDFFLGNQAKGIIWCSAADGETVRAEAQRQNPDMPITRHPLKTVVTHIREVDAADEHELHKLYERQKNTWVEESFAVVNRLIDAYCWAALDDKTRGETGRVAFWDVRHIVISFWHRNATHQLGGHMQWLRPETPSPEPLDADRQKMFEEVVLMKDEYPLPRLLSANAWAHLQRGNYRAAVVDDFNAIEVAISEYARELAARRKVPKKDLEAVFKRLRFDGICDLISVLGGVKLRQWTQWPLVKKAQEIRNKVVHHGARATSADAKTVHDAATWTLTYVVIWLADSDTPKIDDPSPEAPSVPPDQ